jgi:division protein CdvB (Snf7/Vps24/ESCRT-III family)
MSKEKPLSIHNEPATKGDVESIVTRVILTIVPPMVEEIVERVVDEKLDRKLNEKLGEFSITVDEKIDSLAAMVGRGFADTQAQINEFKSEMYEFRGETEQSLYGLNADMGHVKKRLDGVESRLDGVEGAINVMTGMWRDHETRIGVLES